MQRGFLIASYANDPNSVRESCVDSSWIFLFRAYRARKFTHPGSAPNRRFFTHFQYRVKKFTTNSRRIHDEFTHKFTHKFTHFFTHEFSFQFAENLQITRESNRHQIQVKSTRKPAAGISPCEALFSFLTFLFLRTVASNQDMSVKWQLLPLRLLERSDTCDAKVDVNNTI